MRHTGDTIKALGMENIADKILKLAAVKFLQVSKADKETAAFRMGVCMGCEHRDAIENRCKICKCFLEIKTETAENRNIKQGRYEITHCPLGKWNDLLTANEYRKIDGLPLINSQ